MSENSAPAWMEVNVAEVNVAEVNVAEVAQTLQPTANTGCTHEFWIR